jgi:hypothetical protein
MKRIAAALAAVAVLAATLPASADGFYRPYRPYPAPYPYHHHRHDDHGAAIAAGAIGLLGGALIAGALASPPAPVYAPAPVYVPPPVPVYAAPPVYAPVPVYASPVPVYAGPMEPRVAWCHSRYRSYNPYTNTFTDNFGRQRVCISPYG